MQKSIRILPHEIASGPANMAGDEALLTSAVGGVAALRFYGWLEATVSLGYFQAVSCRQGTFADLPFVRRPTGGGMLVHHHELTYALALPADRSSGSWLIRMHKVIASALHGLGIEVRQEGQCATAPAEEALCFRRWSCGDLTLAGHKVVGSAQRKQRQCLLQHGAVLLQASPHVPQMKGLRDLCDVAVTEEMLQAAITAQLREETDWEVIAGAWMDAEMDKHARLIAERYGNRAWNEKR